MCRPVICGSPYLPTSDDWVLQITNVLSSVALRAALVTAISEDLEKTVKMLMVDIPNLRDMVSNENTHEIWVVAQILLTRKNRTDDFCIELVHDVLERNSLILNGRYFSDWVTKVSLFFMNPTLPS